MTTRFSLSNFRDSRSVHVIDLFVGIATPDVAPVWSGPCGLLSENLATTAYFTARLEMKDVAPDLHFVVDVEFAGFETERFPNAVPGECWREQLA